MSSINNSPDKKQKSSETIEKSTTDYSQIKLKGKIKKKNNDKSKTNEMLNMNKKNNNNKLVTWKINYLDIVSIPSYKKYNLDNTHDDPNIQKQSVKCRCFIF